jgi:hypothetical protein
MQITVDPVFIPVLGFDWRWKSHALHIKLSLLALLPEGQNHLEFQCGRWYIWKKCCYKNRCSQSVVRRPAVMLGLHSGDVLFFLSLAPCRLVSRCQNPEEHHHHHPHRRENLMSHSFRWSAEHLGLKKKNNSAQVPVGIRVQKCSDTCVIN